MYYVYVLESINFKYHYVGLTTNLEKRLNEHNNGTTKSNKAYLPFKIIYFEEIETREKAREREKYFKSSAGRRLLQKILAP